MELRVLRYFLAAAREGSVSKAAAALHLTQPTLSRQLADLEEELGHKLFRRCGRSLKLTSEGLLLQRRASEIEELVAKTESEFTSMGSVISGDIYIGGGETQTMSLITDEIMKIREAHPAVRSHIYSAGSEDAAERLDKGMLDFALLIEPADLSRYGHIFLGSGDVWGVVMPSDCALAKKEGVTRDDLAGAPLISSRLSGTRAGMKNACAEWYGEGWDRLTFAADYNLIFNASLMVRSGIGYALAMGGLIDETEHSGLCFRPLSPRLVSRTALVWKKDQLFSPPAQLFLDRMREKYAPELID